MELTQQVPRRSGAFGVLQQYLAPYRLRVALLLLLLLAGAAATLLNPQILADFIDAVFGNAAPGRLYRLGALFLALALANQAMSVATNYLGTDIGLRATNRIRAELTLHCLDLDMAFHHGTTPGVLVERIDGDVARLNQFLATFAVLLLRNALLILGALGALWAIDWRAGSVLTLFVAVMLLALEVQRRAALPSIRREREASAELFGLVEERLSGSEDIRANGAVGYTMARFAEVSRPWARHTIVSHTLSATTFQLANLLFLAGMALALGIGAWLLGIGAVTIGGVYAIYRYVELMRWPIQQIGRQIQDLQQAAAAITRVEELLAIPRTIRYDGTRELPAGPLGLSLGGVGFAYTSKQGAHAALGELSFDVAPGQILGLLGRTGSGKSTIARLLTRQYEPQHGTIALAGLPLGSVTAGSLRARVGLVTQDVQLFAASVRDNLSLFDPAIPDAALLEALRAAELWEWYQSLPDGLDSRLSAGGGGMSAGQAQLLAFARVLLRDPGLVILDEASARLDPATERRMDTALDRLLHGRTAIIIAHRLATVQRADMVLVLEHGRALEFGGRIDLASDESSRFARLLHAGMEEVLR